MPPLNQGFQQGLEQGSNAITAADQMALAQKELGLRQQESRERMEMAKADLGQRQLEAQQRSEDFARLNASNERISTQEQLARAEAQKQEQTFQAEQAEKNRAHVEAMAKEEMRLNFDISRIELTSAGADAAKQRMIDLARLQMEMQSFNLARKSTVLQQKEEKRELVETRALSELDSHLRRTIRPAEEAIKVGVGIGSQVGSTYSPEDPEALRPLGTRILSQTSFYEAVDEAPPIASGFAAFARGVQNMVGPSFSSLVTGNPKEMYTKEGELEYLLEGSLRADPNKMMQLAGDAFIPEIAGDIAISLENQGLVRDSVGLQPALSQVYNVLLNDKAVRGAEGSEQFNAAAQAKFDELKPLLDQIQQRHGLAPETVVGLITGLAEQVGDEVLRSKQRMEEDTTDPGVRAAVVAEHHLYRALTTASSNLKAIAKGRMVEPGTANAISTLFSVNNLVAAAESGDPRRHIEELIARDPELGPVLLDDTIKVFETLSPFMPELKDVVKDCRAAVKELQDEARAAEENQLNALEAALKLPSGPETALKELESVRSRLLDEPTDELEGLDRTPR